MSRALGCSRAMGESSLSASSSKVANRLVGQNCHVAVQAPIRAHGGASTVTSGSLLRGATDPSIGPRWRVFGTRTTRRRATCWAMTDPSKGLARARWQYEMEPACVTILLERAQSRGLMSPQFREHHRPHPGRHVGSHTDSGRHRPDARGIR